MRAWEVRHGDCLAMLADIPADAVIVSDPPYGMAWDVDTVRFSGGNTRRGVGKSDSLPIAGDREPFDPSPWLRFAKVVLWGSNHFGQRLPVGTTLVWVKRNDTAFGTFLSDAEIGWQSGGHGAYCFKLPHQSVNSEAGKRHHPTQKPVELMRWCIDRLKLAPGTLIVDPYCGSGTTGVASIQAGMRFLGIEREERYVTIARQRIAAAAAQTSLNLEAA